MMYIPVTLLRLFTSFYILTVPVSAQFATPDVTQQYVDYSKKTSTALGPSGASRVSPKYSNPSCDYQPNFRCASQDICIPVKQVLNGYKDCPDGSDEDARKVDFCKLGSAFHHCDANSRCVTTAFGYRCQCKEGFTGDGFYCEKFPLGIQIAVTFGNADRHDTPEDTPIHFNVSIVVVPHGYNSNLSLTVMGLPKDARFDIGQPCNQTAWCFTDLDFSFGTYINAQFFPPRDWSGTIALTIIAEIYREDYWVTGYSAATLEVTAVPDTPVLRVGTVCYENSTVNGVIIPVSARLSDNDGSEELEIDLDGLPEGFDVSTSPDEPGHEGKQQGASTRPDSIMTSLTVKPTGEMRPFNATVVAISREKSNGKENLTKRIITVQQCPPYPKMNVIFEVPNEALEGRPIPFHITVQFELDESPRLISIQLQSVPAGATLNRGHRINSTAWLLSRQDLADDTLLVFPPPHFSGQLQITGTSEVLYRGFQYNLNSTASLDIIPVVNTPVLHVAPDVVCLSINATSISFSIEAALADDDGSETLIIQYSIPEEWTGSVGDSYHGSYSLVVTEKSRDLINVTVTSPLGFIYPTEIPVVVMAVEKVNADQNIVFTKVKVMACDSAQQAAASNFPTRTTIIWNITTPSPDMTDSAGKLRSAAFHKPVNSSRAAQLNLSSIYRPISNASLPRPVIGGNQTSATGFRNATHSDAHVIAESRQVALALPDSQSQDDEIPRPVRNFSGLVTPTTGSPSKAPRVAKTTEESGGSRPRNPKTRRGKTKRPHVPGRAELDGVELEQFVSIDNGTEDLPVRMNVTVVWKNNPPNSSMVTRIFGLPPLANLSKGRRENASNSWLLQHPELGPLVISLPQHLSGNIPLTVSSTITLPTNKSLTARENFQLVIRPVTDSGRIQVQSPYFEKHCFDKTQNELQFSLKVLLEDNDGSEDVEYLEVTGVPRSVQMIPGRYIGSETSRLILPNELPNVVFRVDSGVFPRFRILMDAKIREKETGLRTSSVTKEIVIVPCTNGALTSAESGERNQRNTASLVWSASSRPYLNGFLCLLWTLLIL